MSDGDIGGKSSTRNKAICKARNRSGEILQDLLVAGVFRNGKSG